jgi:hypothetical protein
MLLSVTVPVVTLLLTWKSASRGVKTSAEFWMN